MDSFILNVIGYKGIRRVRGLKSEVILKADYRTDLAGIKAKPGLLGMDPAVLPGQIKSEVDGMVPCNKKINAGCDRI